MSQNNRDPQRLKGFFLEFTDEESSEIHKMLEEEGYAPSCKGLRDFILDEVNGTEEEPVPKSLNPPPPDHLKSILDYVQDNPQMVTNGIKGLTNLTGALMAGIKKGRRT